MRENLCIIRWPSINSTSQQNVCCSSQLRQSYLRNLMGFQVTIGLFYSVTKIPLSQNVMLLQLAQVVMPLVDRFLQKANYSLIELSISVIAVFAVYLLLDGKEQQDDDRDYVQGWKKVFVVFVLFMSITLWFSFSLVMIKFKNDNNALHSTICQISYERYEISVSDFILVFMLIGSVGCLSQTFAFKAYTLTKPGKAALFNCLNVIYAFLVEVTILDEYPTLIQLFGASISICCIICSIYLRE